MVRSADPVRVECLIPEAVKTTTTTTGGASKSPLLVVDKTISCYSDIRTKEDEQAAQAVSAKFRKAFGKTGHFHVNNQNQFLDAVAKGERDTAEYLYRIGTKVSDGNAYLDDKKRLPNPIYERQEKFVSAALSLTGMSRKHHTKKAIFAKLGKLVYNDILVSGSTRVLVLPALPDTSKLVTMSVETVGDLIKQQIYDNNQNNDQPRSMRSPDDGMQNKFVSCLLRAARTPREELEDMYKEYFPRQKWQGAFHFISTDLPLLMTSCKVPAKCIMKVLQEDLNVSVLFPAPSPCKDDEVWSKTAACQVAFSVLRRLPSWEDSSEDDEEEVPEEVPRARTKSGGKSGSKSGSKSGGKSGGKSRSKKGAEDEVVMP
jgi:hypothetical protein